MSLELIHSPLLNRYKSIVHFTTTINGGVSSGNYATLNLGLYSGDLPENVMENRFRLAATLGLPLENLFFPYQTHEDKVCVIDEAFINLPKEQQSELLNGVDALITNIPSVCIGVTTADCVPILLFDPSTNVVAAVHAGWRGTIADIAAKTLNKMIRIFGCCLDSMLVYIGPAISEEYFEVGDEVVLAFENAGYDLSQIQRVNTETNKSHLNLKKANQIRLEQLGILSSNIDMSDICTYKSSDMLFSARRQSVNSGRNITGISISNNLL
ncbi:peptidoglycan editing factor PgeF [Dysgonomonas macrotermitis]|uniref:Purine nucleoside phosphorylase n=1 Tax=Dysgonomonas macrotermitis TaxID=1346286 RepID=A0A1M5FBI9_9BACT|nr:peptidoglycan editing factor PgeF [Dysgonomonas macrotermitis]SHF88809.1 conserved hypothetical protein [Dysgonomonas macrotermitis]